MSFHTNNERELARIDNIQYSMDPVGVLKHLKGYATYINAGWRPRWDDEAQIKFSPHYDHEKKEWLPVSSRHVEVSFFYFPSTHRCEKFIVESGHWLTILRNLIHTDIEEIL